MGFSGSLFHAYGDLAYVVMAVMALAGLAAAVVAYGLGRARPGL
jgi:hypothetical protein